MGINCGHLNGGSSACGPHASNGCKGRAMRAVIMTLLCLGIPAAILAEEGNAETETESTQEREQERSAGTVECTVCAAKGRVDCDGCDDGDKLCPDRCMKIDKGPRRDEVSKRGFVHVYFVDQNGRTHKTSAGAGHAGEIFDFLRGQYRKVGICETCSGDARVDCQQCKGVGHVPCSECDGSKAITQERLKEIEAKKSADRVANSFVLKNGTMVEGKFIGLVNGVVSIKQDDGEWVEILVEDLQSVPEQFSDRIALEPDAARDGDE